MFSCKPDFETVLNRYDAWWQCEILDRPLVNIAFGKPESERIRPPESNHATLRDRWMDAQFQADLAHAQMHNTVFYADALPKVIPNLGPEVFSAFYGCPLEFGTRTSWSEPILHDWSDESLAQLQLDRDNTYYRAILEITDALLEVARGQFIVGYTDLHGGGDAVAAFRDPQALLIDTLEYPEKIKLLCDRITDDFLDVFDLYHDKLSAEGMPSMGWAPVAGSGKVHIPSNDFSCMISQEAFEDLFVPGIVRECKHMDRNLYHLDGPDALRFLDLLLDIPGIQAVHWVPGAGQDYWADWIEVYQRIQARGKAMQILHVPADDLPLLFRSLDPHGVWVSGVSGIGNQEQADAVLNQFATWTKRQS
jgi:hypothetical protein